MKEILVNKIPERINLQLEKPFYKGSVQNLYEVAEHKELLVSETTSGGSVFDVGTIFNIEGSDIGRASFRHLVFQELQNPGAWEALSTELPEVKACIQKDGSGEAEKLLSAFCRDGAHTHHMGMIERESGKVYGRGFPSVPSNLTLIRKFKVEKPELRKVLGWHFYDYEKYNRIDGNVIPLEYIVRLGITSGSSILRKYNALSDSGKTEYLRELGVEKSLAPWTQFELPLVDLTTKYEPEDRNISRQEAALISGVNGNTFSRSMLMAILGAFLVKQIFSRMGLFLWDLKWEIARDGDSLVFVDTIDTDSVRVTMNIERGDKLYFIHFNKQAMRDYYRIMHADWYRAINDAKKAAALEGRPFTEILSEGQKKEEYPATPTVDRAFLDIQREKFYMIQNFIQDQSRDMRDESERIALMELDYYLKSGNKEQYEEINSV
jgi:phosphoribosylaminoimidazole-succinocarboxamide synthase